MAKQGNGTVIIKKIKKGGAHGHHGGAWKVAYADFVTAMMAFFLLLWLLNVTTDVQKHGIADYFEPSILLSQAQSGANGILGGKVIGAPGASTKNSAAPALVLPVPSLRQPDEGDEADEDGQQDKQDPSVADKSGGTATGQKVAGTRPESVTDKVPKEQAQKEKAEREKQEQAQGQTEGDKSTFGKIAGPGNGGRQTEREERQFAAAEFALRQAVQDIPELKNLAENLVIDRTPEGLRIQVVDQDKISMFPLGSSSMYEPTKKLMQLIAQVVARMPQKITVTGHTDSTPFTRGVYGNWELSTDRANSSRRELVVNGLSPDRIARVVGVADKDPLLADQPASPRNRRMSILLMRDAAPPSGTGPAIATLAQK